MQADRAPEQEGARQMKGTDHGYGSRAEHLARCKQRALEYVEAGDLHSAFVSMNSDLRKHPETADHKATELGMMLMLSGHLDSPAEMRRWIEGYQ
jgi:hypothetical protein